MKSVPAQASASVAYNIDTHMTHRAEIYEFPVPWCNINWGSGASTSTIRRRCSTSCSTARFISQCP